MERTRGVTTLIARHLVRTPSSRSDRDRPDRSRDERGSVLIVAFIYLIAVSITVLGLSNWVATDLGNVKSFTNSREQQMAAQSTVKLAIQNIRYTPLLGTGQTWGQFNYCWGSGGSTSLTIDGFTFDAYCSTVWNPTSAVSRTVTVDACLATVTQAACIAPGGSYLQAVVVFDDYPPGGAAPVNGSCTLWSWCGEGETITSWVWQ
jgi:hypothetical protein